MTREIKFRAKELHEPSRWHYGYYVKHKLNNPCPVMFNGETAKDKEVKYEEYLISEYDGDWEMGSVQYKVVINPKTVGQYTGLKDKNGNKIFEGDILEFEFDNIGKQNAIVYWNKKYTSFLLDTTISNDFDYAEIQDGRIIGNVYDNPEFLKGGLDD